MARRGTTVLKSLVRRPVFFPSSSTSSTGPKRPNRLPTPRNKIKQKQKQMRAEVYTSMLFAGFPFDSQTLDLHLSMTASPYPNNASLAVKSSATGIKLYTQVSRPFSFSFFIFAHLRQGKKKQKKCTRANGTSLIHTLAFFPLLLPFFLLPPLPFPLPGLGRRPLILEGHGLTRLRNTRTVDQTVR